jgi:signal transduction histidine kinase
VVGTNRWDLKDPDGVPFVRKIITTAKTGKAGWTDYKYMDPITKTVQAKSSYAVAFDDLIIGSGLYKD